jgi:hypothetical protein
MLTYSKIKDNSRLLQNFTGLNCQAFSKLLLSFEKAYETALAERDAIRERPRQRQRGGGRKAVLVTGADKLLFILFYFKFYPTQEVLGFFFGFGKSQANEWIQRLSPILSSALGYEQRLPARQPADVAHVLAQCPGLEFIIDGSERPIQRPKDKERQKQNYSGKKKRHTVKNIVISDKKIKVLSQTHEGKKHDKTLADEEHYSFPEGSSLYQDTGFQGYKPDNVIPQQPKKKPRGGELTAEEKARNKEISRQRIGVEHAIGGAKVYHIVRDVFRHHLKSFEDLVMIIACGLHNLRVDHRQSATG